MFGSTQELREVVDRGRKAKITSEFMQDFLTQKRAQIIFALETTLFDKQDDVLGLVLYLRILRDFEKDVKTCIDAGDIAQKELNENGGE